MAIDNSNEPCAATALTLQFFAALVAGGIVAIALHELGHATSVWSVGGDVSGCVLHPFPFCGSTIIWSVEQEQWKYLMVGWGGVSFGSIYAFVLGELSKGLVKEPMIRLAGVATALVGLATNAMYLIVGGVSVFGDTRFLHGLGVEKWIFVVAGIPLAACAIKSYIDIHHVIGLSESDSVTAWIVVTQGGIAMYVLACLLYRHLFPDTWFKPNQIMSVPWLYVLLTVPCLITLGVRRYRVGNRRNDSIASVSARQGLDGSDLG